MALAGAPIWLSEALVRLRLTGVVLLAVTTAVVVAIAGGGSAEVWRRAVSREDTSYTGFWLGARRLIRPALGLACAQIAVLFVLLSAIWFYTRVGGVLGMAGGGAAAYALLFFLMMAVYHYPALAAQEAGVFDDPDRTARRGAVAAMRRSFFLALGSPFFTLGVLGVEAVIVIACRVSLVLVPIALTGAVSLVATVAMRELLIRHGIVPPPPADGPAPDQGFQL